MEFKALSGALFLIYQSTDCKLALGLCIEKAGEH